MLQVPALFRARIFDIKAPLSLLFESFLEACVLPDHDGKESTLPCKLQRWKLEEGGYFIIKTGDKLGFYLLFFLALYV